MNRKALHGEVIFVECVIPASAKKIEVKEDFFVVGESETHGNDHRVAVCEGIDVYECEGKLYLRNSVDATVYCPNKERHSPKVLPPTDWEIKKANEFDFLANEERIVKD